tara:strand:- start:23495 stop:24538 length:1044 start_codon:yes stop_codon:yes gene_type:complete
MSNYYEELTLGRRFRHATARTITDGEVALNIALTGARQPIGSSAVVAKELGYAGRPVDDFLLFNIAFGKTVADISFNARGNLGYAGLRFLRPVYVGDTIRAESEVIGRREASNGLSGVVYVRSAAFNQDNECVLEFVRWVLVRKRIPEERSQEVAIPQLPEQVRPESILAPPVKDVRSVMANATGVEKFYNDYRAGDRIIHEGGITIDESDHTLATRLFQNNAMGHFDTLVAKEEGREQRIVYGGYVIALCRALSYDGFENVVSIAAINAGSHVGPTFAGDTIYSVSDVIEMCPLSGRSDLGAMRLRLWGVKNRRVRHEELSSSKGERRSYDPAVVLELDYTVLVPI